jgi:hypothetical protein
MSATADAVEMQANFPLIAYLPSIVGAMLSTVRGWRFAGSIIAHHNTGR